MREPARARRPGARERVTGGRSVVAACAYWQWWFWGPGELLRVLCPPVSSVRRVLSCPGLRFWESISALTVGIHIER